MRDGQKFLMNRNRFDISFLTELQDFQERFAAYFNVASVIFDTDGKQITRPSGFNKFCELIQKAKNHITLAKKELDWIPKVELEEGLIKTIEYFDNLLKNDPRI